MGGAWPRPGLPSDGAPASSPQSGRSSIAGGANIRELWAEQNPYSGWAASGCQSSFQFVLPRQQIRRDQIEARRVAWLFEHLEHIDDELPPLAGSASARSASRHRSRRRALLSGLALAITLACLPWLQPVGPGHWLVVHSHATMLLAHTAAGLLTYATMGPVLRLLSSLVLRLARVQGSWATAQAVYLNGMLLREERVASELLLVVQCYHDSADTVQAMHGGSAPAADERAEEAAEFAFLTSKLRSRFQSDVLSNAFERAALQRLAQLSPERRAGVSPTKALHSTPVLPDVGEPHAFERYTAEMLKAAFGLRDGAAKAPSMGVMSSKPVSRHNSTGTLQQHTGADGTPLSRGGVLPPSAFKTLSTTMFVMQQEADCVEIEDEARGLFEQLANRHWVGSPSSSPSHIARTDSLSSLWQPLCGSAGANLLRSDLVSIMPSEDADRTWQLLTLRSDGDGTGGGAAARFSVSEQEFVQAVRGTFERFHMLAATVKDYAAIWLVFSNVLAAVQVAVAIGIILAVFFPPQVLRTVCISVPTAFLGVSFVFGGLLREIFESLVLILLVQPYDVGDRICLPDGDDAYRTFIVQKINILTTEARDLSNQCVYLKNSILFQESRIMNLGRSLNAVVELSFEMPAEQFTLEIVNALEGFVRQYMSYRAVNWVPTYLRSFTPIANGRTQCDLSGAVTHRFRLMHRKPWQHIREIRNDTTNVLYALIEEMRRLGLDFRLPAQPVHLEGLGAAATPPAGERPRNAHPAGMPQVGPAASLCAVGPLASRLLVGARR
eukprot:CAMPEP_0179070116 /NCGR_PEP_ID=MMETSP0796-20121207/30855_1 /TAXON_ID=73915 /ORGANISM="Pyrodinium bahamense, Strain pbaha01" /LENGTH=780 /DNA_ID=CAMNT_0020767199 /DNA_START=45 /DNA_END=2389 /DNA_ORIENTATION=+